MEKIRYLILLPFFVSNIFTKAQMPANLEAYKDSLNSVLKKTTSDSVKAIAHYKLTSIWAYKDKKKALQLLDNGRKLSRKNNFLWATSYSAEGYIYFSENPEKSEQFYLKADRLLNSYTNKEAYTLRSNIWQNLAVIKQINDDDEGHINLLLSKAIPYAQKAQNNSILGTLYNSVGVAFMNTEQFDKAEIYFNKAIAILEKTQDIYRLIASYNWLGETYIFLEKYHLVKNVLLKNKELLKPYPNTEHYRGYYLVEGLYFDRMKQYDKAIKSYENGIKAANGPNKDFQIQDLQLHTVKALLGKKDYAAAENLLLKLSSSEDLMSFDTSRLEIYKYFDQVYAGLGNKQKAYDWQKKYIVLNDSLLKAKTVSQINELELKYSQAENQKKITELSLKKNQAELNSKNNQLLALAFSSLAILASIILFFVWRARKNEKKLAKQVEINYIQKIENLKNLKKLELSQAILEGEEHERKRLARELHDGLGSWLSGIRINFLNLKNKNAIEQKDFNAIDEQLDVTIKELRSISHNLLPETLVKLGLEKSLQDLCNQLSSEKLKIDLQTYGINKDLSENFQISVFRIIQELLNNAVKHSEATEVLVSCTQDADLFLITVEDNGKGFSKDASEKGIGLKNIENRVQFLNGKIDIETGEKGTGIYIEFQDYRNQNLLQIG